MVRAHTRTLAIAATVKQDFAAVAGKVIKLKSVTAIDENNNSVEQALEPPLDFQVRATALDGDLTRVCDGWVDPIWDVVPLEPKDPQIAGLSAFYCYGPSYHLYSEDTEPGDRVPGSPAVPAPATPVTPVMPAAAPIASGPPAVSTPSFRVSFTIHGDVVVKSPKASLAMVKAYAMSAKDLVETGRINTATMNRITEIT